MTPIDSNYLSRNSFLAINFVTAIGYVALCIALGGASAIEIYNAFLFGAAAGVVVAYGLPAWTAIKQPYLTGADMLRVGIFISWSSVLMSRTVSIIWRFYGKPPDWLDSVAWGLHVPGSLMAAYAHIISPAALDGRVPTKRMVEAGFLVTIAATTGALIFIFGDNVDWW